MKIPERAIRHRITTMIVFAGLAVFGFISLRRLGLELFPEITYPTAAIVTPYPGVDPLEVESAVSKPIESAVSNMSGVQKVSSTSMEGVSIVTVNFTWGTDVSTIVADLRERVTSIENDFPDGVERSLIYRFSPQVLPVYTFAISSPEPGLDLRRLTEEKVVPEIEKQQGVASVSVFGGAKAALTCRMDLDALARCGVSIVQVLQAFTAENVSLPGGSIAASGRQIVLRAVGEFKSESDVEDVLVGFRGTVPIRMRDVAQVSLAFLPQEEFVRAVSAAGSGSAVQVSVQKTQGVNTVQVIDRVKARLSSLKAELPPSVRLDTGSDQSVSIKESISGLTDAAWQGGLLAVLVLLFFLRNWRSVLIVALSIPISIIATFTLMDFMHISLNIMSLAGLTLGVGMFVDSAIVVLEVTFRKQLAGMTPLEAAAKGAGEVTHAIAVSTLTNVIVFVPLVFTTGMANLILKDLAYTLSFSMLMAMIMALTLVPVLCVRFLRITKNTVVTRPKSREEKVELEISLADVETRTGIRPLDWMGHQCRRVIRRLDGAYERSIRAALRKPWLVIGAAAVLMALSIGAIVLMGMEFLPETDEARLSIEVETKPESTYARTEEKVRQIEDVAKSVLGADLQSLSSTIGRSGSTLLGETGSHLARISVNLVSKDRRSRSIWAAIEELSPAVRGKVSDVKCSFNVDGLGNLINLVAGDEKPVVVEISAEDTDRAYAYALKVAEMMKGVRGARDVEVSYKLGKPELQFRIRREEATGLGVSAMEIAAMIRAAYKGMNVSRFRKGNDAWDVTVLLNEEDRNSLERMSTLFVVNPMGTRIPVENLVDISPEKGPVSVERVNRTRLIKVTAALSGERPLDRVTGDVQNGMAGLGKPPVGVTAAITGARGQMTDTFGQLGFALLLGAGLVYLVMAAQFESLLLPLIIMFSIPFALIGLVAALVLTNTPFSMVAFIGAILLVGYVVNNAILLVDYFGILRGQGLTLERAVELGGRTRLKPILMSTGTTILGLLPMALGLGTGAELRAPMARAVFGGLASSTLITLILIPTIYYVVESRRRNGRAK